MAVPAKESLVWIVPDSREAVCVNEENLWGFGIAGHLLLEPVRGFSRFFGELVALQIAHDLSVWHEALELSGLHLPSVACHPMHHRLVLDREHGRFVQTYREIRVFHPSIGVSPKLETQRITSSLKSTG